MYFNRRDLVAELDGMIASDAHHVTVQLKVLKSLLGVARAARRVVEASGADGIEELRMELGGLTPPNTTSVTMDAATQDKRDNAQ